MNDVVGWFVVVERCTMDLKPMEPYVVGPWMSEATAQEELESDSGLIFCLLTIDAKNERYIAGGDVYLTKTPPDGPRIHPSEHRVIYLGEGHERAMQQLRT